MNNRIIHNSSKLNCPSTDEWTNNIMINPYNGILPGNKKESTANIHNMDNLNIVLSKRSQTKKSTC